MQHTIHGMADDVEQASSAEAANQPGMKQRERRGARTTLLLKSLLFSALTYAAMVLYAFRILPLWGLIAANVLFYIRAYLRMHDLCHAFSTKGWVVRFLPTALFANPVWGGVAPFITTHVQHHQYLGTNQDPWLQYYAGHPLRALFFNMIEPEINLYNYVQQGRADRKLAENLSFDLLRHGLNLFFFQWAYVTHVLIQRTCHGLGVFLFNFWPHREKWTADAAIGSFNREQAIQPYAWFFKAFWGKAMTEAGMYHNRHHVLGQMLEPSHRYVELSDDGGYTRFNDRWPLPSVQFLASGPKGNFG
jgi:fatty acid desaturase